MHNPSLFRYEKCVELAKCWIMQYNLHEIMLINKHKCRNRKCRRHTHFLYQVNYELTSFMLRKADSIRSVAISTYLSRIHQELSTYLRAQNGWNECF